MATTTTSATLPHKTAIGSRSVGIRLKNQRIQTLQEANCENAIGQDDPDPKHIRPEFRLELG